MSISKKEKLEIINNIFYGHEEYWVDTKGFIQATNLEAITITGYEEAEMIGKHFSILYPFETLETNLPQSHLTFALESGSFKEEVILVRKSNIKFVAKINFESVEHEKGKVVKVTIQDRTYTSAKKTKMKRLESHFNSLFHNHFIGVLNICYTTRKIIDGNAKASEILGDNDYANMSFDHYFKTDDNEQLQKLDAFFSPDNGNDLELCIFRKNGEARWVRMSQSTFASEEMIELLLFDITDDKKRIEHLERINHQLDQFIYHISHDLRAPLATLLGLFNLSKKEGQSVRTIHSYIDMMEQRTSHLDNILQDLTSIVLNEKTTLSLERFHVDKEIRSIINHYSDISRIFIDTRINIQENSPFITDAKRLRVVLRNLIANAIKYQNPAQEHPLIRISVCIDENVATLEIEDNGIGIAQEYIGKVFDIFFRATDKSSGSGLGLYIVKSMVDKLEGSLSVTSTLARGSTFRITLPNRNSNHLSSGQFELLEVSQYVKK